MINTLLTVCFLIAFILAAAIAYLLVFIYSNKDE